MADVLCR